jgi:hypothetical protein
MTANALAGAPGEPAESHVDSAACAIVCPPQGLGLAGSFCWLCRNDSDVEYSSGDASRHPNGPAPLARGSRREARPEPAAAPDSRCTTSGCSAPAGETRGR